MGSSRTSALARGKKVALRGLSGRGSRGGPLGAVGRPSWKLLGLAGIAGVAATGVVVARNRRAQRDVSPDELRERLHSRLSEVGAEPPEAAPPAPPG